MVLPGQGGMDIFGDQPGDYVRDFVPAVAEADQLLHGLRFWGGSPSGICRATIWCIVTCSRGLSHMATTRRAG
jgi:hypothetical protein